MTAETAIQKLGENLNYIIQQARACSYENLNKKDAGKWGNHQILEHIYLTEESIHRLLLRRPDKQNQTAEIFGNEKLKRMLVDQRAYKITAPDYLIPTGKYSNIEDFVDEFLLERNALTEDIRAGRIIVDSGIHNHPVLGEMTVPDWIHFLIHHSVRHLEQIKDNFVHDRQQATLKE